MATLSGPSVCAECRDGEESFCRTHRAHGFDVPGAFAEYVLADARFAARLPGGDPSLLAPLMCAGRWDPDDRAHVCVNFVPTTATWDVMVAAIRPRGGIVAAAMVSEPAGLNQEWPTASGVRITGTGVGTRAQMTELMAVHAREPLGCEVTKIALEDVTDALSALDRGTARGRFCVMF